MPGDLSAAIALAERTDANIKLIAGGQSLGPMLNLRLVQPDLLVDITAIPELKRFEQKGDVLFIGSCITHADIEDGRVPDVTGGAMRAIAAGIAYRAVRNRGTIGGSLVHADPSADWISALAALGAQAVIFGPNGERRIPVETLVTGVFECDSRCLRDTRGCRSPPGISFRTVGLLQTLPQDRRICARHRGFF